MVNIMKIAPLNHTKYLFCMVTDFEIPHQLLKKPEQVLALSFNQTYYLLFFISNHTTYIRKYMVI